MNAEQHEHAIMRLEVTTDTQVLKRKCQKVSKWSGIRIGTKLIKFISWREIECVGLAAPQLEIFKRVFVLHDGKEFAIFVNPRIVETGVVEEEQVEGCLSLPGKKYKVKRPTNIVVKDAVRTTPFELDGWSARAWLHEFDHLNGRLISDIGEEVIDDAPETFTL
jgi:peptide deformylase